MINELQAVQVFDGRFFITVSQTPEETSRETEGRTFDTETKVHIKAHWFVSAGGHQPGIARESEELPGRNLRSPVQETRRITSPANNRKDNKSQSRVRAGWGEGRHKQRAYRNRCFQLRSWYCACEKRRILLLCCDNLASSLSFVLCGPSHRQSRSSVPRDHRCFQLRSLQSVQRCWSGSFEKLSVQIRHEDQCAQTGVDRSRCPQVSSVSCGKSCSNTMTTTLLGLMARSFREIRCFIPGSPPCSSADARARGSEGARRSGQLLRIVSVGLMLGRSNPGVHREDREVTQKPLRIWQGMSL